MDKLYENIRTRRKELKMTQQELAEKLNKTYGISWEELEEMEIEAYQIGA